MALTQLKTSGIADDAVTTDKLANAINTERTANTAKVSLDADSVTGAKIADDAIDSEHITDGSIDNAHLADDAVGVAELSATGTASSSTFLRGDNSWSAVTSTTINNNADNRLITGSGTANTLEGESNLTWSGSLFKVNTGGTEDCFRVGTDAGADTSLRIGSTGTDVDTHGVIKYDIDDNYFSFLISGESHGSGGVYIENGGKVRLPAGVKLGGTVDANLLEDYEEGTWTPTDGSGASISITNNNTASYTKIGRLVHIKFDVTYASNSSSADATLGGIPFTQGVQYGSGVVGWTSKDSANGTHVHVGANDLYLMDNSGASSSGGKHLRNDEVSGIRMIGNATYFA